MSSDNFPPEDNLVLAHRRAERILEHGSTVVGFSMQAVLAGMSLLWLLPTVPSARDEDYQAWLFLLAVLGSAIAVTSWLVARRRGLLQPFFGSDLEHPFRVLDKSQQEAVAKQLRGRVPLTAECAPLARAIVLMQRRATRAITPSLVGAGLSLLAAGASSLVGLGGAWPWLLMLEVAAVVFIAVFGTAEARRRNRVLEQVARLGASDRTLPQTH